MRAGSSVVPAGKVRIDPRTGEVVSEQSSQQVPASQVISYTNWYTNPSQTMLNIDEHVMRENSLDKPFC